MEHCHTREGELVFVLDDIAEYSTSTSHTPTTAVSSSRTQDGSSYQVPGPNDNAAAVATPPRAPVVQAGHGQLRVSEQPRRDRITA